MAQHFIEFDQMKFKGIDVGFSFYAEVEWNYADKDWCIERIYVAKEAVTSIENGDWVRIDDDADFQWIIPTIEQHVGEDLALADLANEIEFDRKERAA